MHFILISFVMPPSTATCNSSRQHQQPQQGGTGRSSRGQHATSNHASESIPRHRPTSLPAPRPAQSRRPQRVCRCCLYCMRCVCCRPWLVCCCCCCCCCRPQRRTPRCTPAEELSVQSAGAGVQRLLDASGQGIELRRSPRGQRPLLSHSLPHCAVQLAAHLELQAGGQAGRQAGGGR